MWLKFSNKKIAKMQFCCFLAIWVSKWYLWFSERLCLLSWCDTRRAASPHFDLSCDLSVSRRRVVCSGGMRWLINLLPVHLHRQNPRCDMCHFLQIKKTMLMEGNADQISGAERSCFFHLSRNVWSPDKMWLLTLIQNHLPHHLSVFQRKYFPFSSL